MPDPSAATTATPEPDPDRVVPLADEPRAKGRPPMTGRVEKLEADIGEMKSMFSAVLDKLDQLGPAAAEPVPDTTPNEMTVAEWGAGGRYRYSSRFKNLTVIMSAGKKIIVNSQVVQT